VLCFVLGGCVLQRKHDVASLCILQDTIPEGGHTRAVVSGIYRRGLETAILSDSACPDRNTWVEFDLQSTSNEEQLEAILASSYQADLVVEGDFYGPPESDPKLPESLRKAFRPRWGHLSCCQTKLVIHEIKEVKRVPTDPPDASSEGRP